MGIYLDLYRFHWILLSLHAWSKSHALRLVACTSVCAEGFHWLDPEGASLIGTLRKAWFDNAPASLAWLVMKLCIRAHQLGSENGAASESASLAVAHLLPLVIRCCLPSPTTQALSP